MNDNHQVVEALKGLQEHIDQLHSQRSADLTLFIQEHRREYEELESRFFRYSQKLKRLRSKLPSPGPSSASSRNELRN